MADTNRCPDPETLSLNTLHLLQSDEQLALKEHLSTCRNCQRERAALDQTLSTLALTAPLRSPSPTLKPRVMAAIDHLAASERRPRLRPRWQGWGIGVAAALLAMALGLQQFASSRADHSPTGDIRLAVKDAKRQGAQVIALEGTKDAPRAYGELYVVQAAGPLRRVILSVEGLASPVGSQVYCLWLIKDGQRSIGGWLTVDRTGKGGLVFETTELWDTMGVTLEPDLEYMLGPYGDLRPRGPKVLGIPNI